MIEEVYNDIFEFDDIVIVKDQNKETIIEALDQLKTKAEEFSKTCNKDEKLAICIVDIGYQLDIKNQSHIEII